MTEVGRQQFWSGLAHIDEVDELQGCRVSDDPSLRTDCTARVASAWRAISAPASYVPSDPTMVSLVRYADRRLREKRRRSGAAIFHPTRRVPRRRT